MGRPPKVDAAKKKQRDSKKKGNEKVLKDQIQALGGTLDDFDLVKDSEDISMTDAAPVDPALSNDVSKFLKNLDLGPKKRVEKAKAPAVDKPKAPVVEKPKGPTVDKPKAPVADKPVADKPKVALPSKVTLNPKSRFVFNPTSRWYTAVSALPSSPAPSPSQLSALSDKASNLHSNDVDTFQSASSSGPSTSEASFLSKIIQSGTLSDRLSALTLLVQSSPVHNIKALETLKGMAERGKGKGGRDESLKALRCIVDWWVGGGAPDRKLKYFRDQPLSHPSVTDEHLLVWYFEDWLKKYFFFILQILETLSLDPLPYVRMQSLRLIFSLLCDKPEQEQNLLRLLVNKLGDNDKSLCSRASYHLLQLLQKHPSMKAVITREIISLVLRPLPTASVTPSDVSNRRIKFGSSSGPSSAAAEKKKATNAHARYYAAITFNQIVLTPSDREVAVKLIEIYFEMFKELLGETSEPVSQNNEEVAEEEAKKDKAGRVYQDNNKGKMKEPKAGKGAAGFAELEDSNSKIISAILTGVNRALPFAKLDGTNAELMKHIDTLFLITHTSTFNISLQALVLIQQIAVSMSSPSAPTSSSVSATAKSITDRYYRTLYSSLHDPRLSTSSKQAMYLNLLFKSIKADTNNGRVKALIRRFVQLLVSGGSGATEFVAGGLFLLGELFSSIPGLREMLNTPGTTESEYDPRKRDPQYAHAETSPLWELTPLLEHYHPAISLHARQILLSQPLTASADLSLNTLSHFLERFVYKNPKKVKRDGDNEPDDLSVAGKAKGPSAMQPAASGLDGTGVKLMKGEVSTGGKHAVNEQAFLKRREADVPVDEIFFHRFFTRKQAREKIRVGKSTEVEEDLDDPSDDDGDDDDDDDDDEEGPEEMDLTGDEEEEEDGSDLEEAEIWKAMQATLPKEGDDGMAFSDTDDSDSDSIPSGLEDGAQDSSDDEGDISLVENSDNEDLISLDEDGPSLIEYDGSDAASEEKEWGGIGGEDKKRKREDGEGNKRKKLRSLPTFASYEDYASMIDREEDEDL